MSDPSPPTYPTYAAGVLVRDGDVYTGTLIIYCAAHALDAWRILWPRYTAHPYPAARLRVVHAPPGAACGFCALEAEQSTHDARTEGA